MNATEINNCNVVVVLRVENETKTSLCDYYFLCVMMWCTEEGKKKKKKGIWKGAAMIQDK